MKNLSYPLRSASLYYATLVLLSQRNSPFNLNSVIIKFCSKMACWLGIVSSKLDTPW